jgi:hypothetical protein
MGVEGDVGTQEGMGWGAMSSISRGGAVPYRKGRQSA